MIRKIDVLREVLDTAHPVSANHRNGIAERVRATTGQDVPLERVSVLLQQLWGAGMVERSEKGFLWSLTDLGREELS